MGESLTPKYLSRRIIIPVERDRNPQLLRQLNAHAALRSALCISCRSCFTIVRADREFDRYAITELPSYIIDWPASYKRVLHTSFNTRTAAAEKFFQLRPKRSWFARSDKWSCLSGLISRSISHAADISAEWSNGEDTLHEEKQY